MSSRSQRSKVNPFLAKYLQDRVEMLEEELAEKCRKLKDCEMFFRGQVKEKTNENAHLSKKISDLENELAHFTQEKVKYISSSKESALLSLRIFMLENRLRETSEKTADQTTKLSIKCQEYDHLTEKYTDACSQLNASNQRILELEKITESLSEKDFGTSEFNPDTISALGSSLEDNSCDESELDTTVETVIRNILSIDAGTQTCDSNVFSDSGVSMDETYVFPSPENPASSTSLVSDATESPPLTRAPNYKTSSPITGGYVQSKNRRSLQFEPSSLYSEDSSFSRLQSSSASSTSDKLGFVVYRPILRKPRTSQEHARKAMEKRLLDSTPQDRAFILSHNKLMNDFIQGDLSVLSSPSFNSYQRMVVHELAKMHGLKHFIEDDNKLFRTERKSVIIRKPDNRKPMLHNLSIFMMHMNIFTPFTPEVVNIIED